MFKRSGPRDGETMEMYHARLTKLSLARKETPEAFDRRMYICMHNSFQGHCALGRRNMYAIQMANSATPAAQKKAQEIEQALYELAHLLRERVDPPKPVK